MKTLKPIWKNQAPTAVEVLNRFGTVMKHDAASQIAWAMVFGREAVAFVADGRFYIVSSYAQTAKRATNRALTSQPRDYPYKKIAL